MFLLITLLLGAFTTFTILKNTNVRTFFWAYPVGLVLINVVMQFFGFIQISFSVLSISLMAALLPALYYILSVLRKKPFALNNNLISEIKNFANSVTRLQWLGLGFIGFKLVAIFHLLQLRPIFSWDVWANWAIGAKLFFYNKSLLLDFPKPYFFGGTHSEAGFASRIMSYPLMNSLSQAWVALTQGYFDEVQVKKWVYFLLVSFVIIVFANFYKKLNLSVIIVLTILFLASPLVSYHAIETYADLPVGIFMALSLIAYFKLAKQNEAQYLHLFYVMILAVLLTKDEGLFYVAPMLFFAFVFNFKNSFFKQQRLKHFLWVGVLALGYLTWLIFKQKNQIIYGGRKMDFGFYPQSLEILWAEFLSLRNYGFIGFLYVACVSVGFRYFKKNADLVLPFITYVLFFLTLYFVSESTNTFLNQGTILFRNILTFYPVLFVLALISLSEHQKPNQTAET